jgi:hypothetical protein
VLSHPVPAALATALVAHLLWVWLIANSGGDLAAQDAWAEFARVHPGSAYNLAWYGGVHPVSYSAISPYVMAFLGVRTTMMVAGTLSAGLLALLLVRSGAVHRPLWPALYGAVALSGNAVSGRVTFGLGTMFGLAAVAVVFAWPERWRSDEPRHRMVRASLTALFSVLATASSPVAGLFVGIVAAALWVEGRRPAAYALGLPAVASVAVSTWLFPFSGQQPMGFTSTLLPMLCGVCGLALAPRSWRTVRIGSGIYVLGIIAVWLIPSPIGSNMTRLGLIFGGVLLLAIVHQSPALRWQLRPRRLGASTVALALAFVTLSTWQVATAARDAISTRPPEAWTDDLDVLVHQLQVRDADKGRVEVVPTRSHREASALAQYVNLARGWNRQADMEQNPLFYDDEPLTPEEYHAWLDRWAVHYVVLATGRPDDAAVEEADLVAGGLSYLDEVWSDANWRIFEVESPTPLVSPPATVTHFDATNVELTVPSAGEVVVRIPYSPWLSLVDEDGEAPGAAGPDTPEAPSAEVYGCLREYEPPTAPGQVEDDWTVLHAPQAGVYRIAAPYKLPRGTPCPDEVFE